MDRKMSSLTQDLGSFVADLSFDRIPSAGCDIARTGIADCFGVLVAGARDPAIALIDREMGQGGGAPFASLIPSGARRSVEAAALVNGVAAHVLDYDDVGLDGHPSAVLVPAILAQGEAGDASGAEMLTAYVAGYEVWAELAAREPTPLHRKGWHPTSVRGAVAAAAACAKLRGLDATVRARRLRWPSPPRWRQA
jgi:2-methylcitrate dehydratase PrpD